MWHVEHRLEPRNECLNRGTKKSRNFFKGGAKIESRIATRCIAQAHLLYLDFNLHFLDAELILNVRHALIWLHHKIFSNVK